MPHHGERAGNGGYPHFVRYIEPVFGRGSPGMIASTAPGIVYYTPIVVTVPTTIDRLGCMHGAVAAGNYYQALYDSTAEAPVNRIAVSASTLCAGVSQKEQVPLVGGDLPVDPGYYFVALEPDNNTDTYHNLDAPQLMAAPANVLHGPTCYREVLGAYAIPPLVATPVWGMSWNKEYYLWARGFLTP